MALIQIDGISGTGKTTVAKELIKRGRKAIDADAEFGYFGDPKTGLPTDEQHQLNWLWDLDKITSFAKSSSDETVYICGGAMNQDKVKDVFKKRFTLVIDNETMRHRLLNRTNNDFGKKPDDLARQLEWNKGAAEYARSIGSTVIDATRPIEQVAQQIIQEAE
jgi:thymidylate kinase